MTARRYSHAMYGSNRLKKYEKGSQQHQPGADGVEEIFTLRGYWIHIWLTDLRFFVLSLSGYAFRLVAIVTPT